MTPTQQLKEENWWLWNITVSDTSARRQLLALLKQRNDALALVAQREATITTLVAAHELRLRMMQNDVDHLKSMLMADA